MKKPLFCTLFCLLFLVGCGKTKALEPTDLSINLIESTEPTATETNHAETKEVLEATEIAPSTEAPTTAPEPTGPSQSPSLPQPQKLEHPSTGYAVYDAVIEKCIWAALHTTGDDIDLLEKKQISDVFRFGDSDSSFQFTCMDLDNNGNEELIISQNNTENSIIYAAYTIDNGNLIWFLKGGERNRYYLRADGKIGNSGSSGAAFSTDATYTYNNGILSLDECYFTDGMRNDGNYWLYSQKEPYDPNAALISQEAYDTATANMYKTYISLNGTALQDYITQDEQAIRSDVAVATYQESQLHGKEKYDLWDVVLNRLWRILKYRLSSEEIKQLTREQLAWIDKKEAAAQNAEAEKGFEIQAEYTKNRINELMNLLQQ